MIQEVKMYQAVCDGCGKKQEQWDGIVAWSDKEQAWDVAVDSDWNIDEKTQKTYCPKCWSFDDNDELVFGNA